jgi:glucoamylase
MMPEQVWDEADMPDTSLHIGQPAGSAVPLVWAHAEYLKLLRSAVDGKVFDRIDPVYERYCVSDKSTRQANRIEIYSRRRPIQTITAGSTLRILEDTRFDVVWSMDDWQTTRTAESRSLGSAGFSADIAVETGADGNGSETGKLSWTLNWPEQNRWLGYNVEVTVEAEQLNSPD